MSTDILISTMSSVLGSGKKKNRNPLEKNAKRLKYYKGNPYILNAK
jgi:hypothetical protein